MLGDRYSIADPYFHTFCYWLPTDGLDIEQFPKAAAHFKRMQARPAVQAALAFEQA